MLKVETEDKQVLIVDGLEKTPVDDEDEAQLLRDIVALQSTCDANPSVEDVVKLVRRDLIRLIKRQTATFTLHLQDLEGDLEDLKENPPGSDGHVLVSLDELKKLVGLLEPIGEVFTQLARDTPRNTPELQAVAQGYQALASSVQEAAAAFKYKVVAYEEAADEEEGEEDGEEGEGDGA